MWVALESVIRWLNADLHGNDRQIYSYHSDAKVKPSIGAFPGTPALRAQKKFECPSLPVGEPFLGHSGLSSISE